MIEAVFISDLHLHPDEVIITERFTRFIEWAAENTQSVYILGDFFHVWPGDDAFDSWSGAIASQLAWLAGHGVKVYFMRGNRDFLLGDIFAKLSHVELLAEPFLITLGGESVLLVHGDRYCTLDKGHQWLRRLTRNKLFPSIFMFLPFKLRNKLVNTIRQASQSNRNKLASNMDVVPSVMLEHLKQHNAYIVIHGHTHQPGLSTYECNTGTYKQYILSDWDDNPKILCYNKPLGFYFDPLIKESHHA